MTKQQTNSAKYVLIEESDRFAFIATYLLKSSGTTGIATGTIKQKEYFQAVLPYFNIPENRYKVLLVDPLDQQALAACQTVLIVDAPQLFEQLANLYTNAKHCKFILVLFRHNAGYVSMLHKTYPSIVLDQLKFNPHKLQPTEHKLEKLVESSYLINRMAFYAYGSFMSYFAGNLLKGTFKTQLLDVAKVAKSFGFTVPPRVKADSAKFLNKKAQDRLKFQKRKLKLLRKKQRKTSNDNKEESPAAEQPTKTKKASTVLRVKRKKITK